MPPQSALLIEDNPDDAALARRTILKSSPNLRLTLAHDGEEALAILFGNAEHEPLSPAFLFLDLNLPKVNGLELLRQIRAHPLTRQTPVIVVTGSSDDEAFLESCSLGVDAYVRKPIDVCQVDAALRQLHLSSLLTGKLL